jgi:hypothetical protein
MLVHKLLAVLIMAPVSHYTFPNWVQFAQIIIGQVYQLIHKGIHHCNTSLPSKGICCHSIEFRQLTASLTELFQQFDAGIWSRLSQMGRSVSASIRTSYFVRKHTLTSFNTRALETNLAYRTVQIYIYIYTTVVQLKPTVAYFREVRKTSEKLRHYIAT